MKFLEKKVKESKIPKLEIGGNITYKYLCVKIRLSSKKKEHFKTCDIIITKTNLFFLNYQNKKFSLLYNVNIKNLTKLAFSKNIPNCLLLHENKELIEGIEVKTESAYSLLTLLDDLYHSYPDYLKN